MMTITWLDADKSCIQTVFPPQGSWSEYVAENDTQLLNYLNDVEQPVNILFDLTHAPTPQEAISMLPTVAGMSFWQHPRFKHAYIYGAENFLKVLINVFKEAYGGISLIEDKNILLNQPTPSSAE